MYPSWVHKYHGVKITALQDIVIVRKHGLKKILEKRKRNTWIKIYYLLIENFIKK